MKLSDEDELELRCLLADRHPCPYRRFMPLFGYVNDMKCPTREILRQEFDKYLAEKEHQKYEEEYPNG